jgi:hypothetical protein
MAAKGDIPCPIRIGFTGFVPSRTVIGSVRSLTDQDITYYPQHSARTLSVWAQRVRILIISTFSDVRGFRTGHHFYVLEERGYTEYAKHSLSGWSYRISRTSLRSHRIRPYRRSSSRHFDFGSDTFESTMLLIRRTIDTQKSIPRAGVSRTRIQVQTWKRRFLEETLFS